MIKPFYIVGPTAVGKSEIAAEAAERCGGEIIGADAFQVYEGLDLLSAKPSAQARSRVRHHLVGCVPLTEEYSVARYQATAQPCLDDIAARGKIPVVVGGSGLYVKALTHGLSPLPPAQQALRAELETWDLASLFARLEALDPVAAQTIDAKNKRRLVRALEVCLTTGGRFSDHRSLWANEVGQEEGQWGILFVRERGEMHDRAACRVESMFPMVIDEVRASENLPLSQTAAKMIGLTEIRAYLNGRLSLPECKDRIKAATRQYAKRQMTWFKREQGFLTMNLSASERDIADEVGSILKRHANRTAANI